MEIKIENIEINKAREENIVHAEIMYPRSSKVDTIQIGLCDVRAADDIRIQYDFVRDGWVIYQSRDYHPHIEGNSYGLEEEWFESAFLPAWKYELEKEEKFTYKPGEKKEPNTFEIKCEKCKRAILFTDGVNDESEINITGQVETLYDSEVYIECKCGNLITLEKRP
jgi:hypothetical protein